MARPDFTALTDLATEKLGARVLFATDEWFAPAKSLIKLEEPQSKLGVFTAQGQWMDGWETMRKRVKGHDWCIIRLGASGIIRGLEVDTGFFTGNYAPRISIQAACEPTEPGAMKSWRSVEGTHASASSFKAVEAMKSEEWDTILEMTPLKPGMPETRHQYFNVLKSKRYTHIRVNLFPDGGVSRLRVYGLVVPNWKTIGQKELDFCSAANGGRVLAWSDTHYGHPKNMLNLGRGVNMGDGWETKRKDGRPERLIEDKSGNIIFSDAVTDWAVVQLGTTMIPSRVDIDTLHFKGNYPESFLLEGCLSSSREAGPDGLTKAECESMGPWKSLLPRTKLGPHKLETFKVGYKGAISHVRLTIFPDGGVSRLRVWGVQAPKAKM